MGALTGLKIIEMGAIGPVPFAGMMLADHGADILRIDRMEDAGLGVPRSDTTRDPTGRGKRSVALDLKQPEAIEAVLRLVENADALIEGFRPGVMERLGLGPNKCFVRNTSLVFGRMTGFGQTGPLAPRAGHDIDYVALSGALHGIGTRDKPVPPLNLVGDYGGGGMLLAFGVLAALLNVGRGGKGQVVDASMTEGAAILTALFHGLMDMGLWKDERAANLLDGAAPFYDAYKTSDGKFLAVGAIEPKFYAVLIEKLGLAGEDLPKQMDRAHWPALKSRIADAIAQRTRAEWEQIFEGTDACVAPVLSFTEAPKHPHNVARGTFVEAYGMTQPAPAPRFAQTPGGIERQPPMPGADTHAALKDWGFAEADIEALIKSGVAR